MRFLSEMDVQKVGRLGQEYMVAVVPGFGSYPNTPTALVRSTAFVCTETKEARSTTHVIQAESNSDHTGEHATRSRG